MYLWPTSSLVGRASNVVDISDPDFVHDGIDVFSILERISSVFSFLGSLVVIITFCASKAFHKPINRLVFYATFGNLITNVATLMARSFIGDHTGAGCQLQAFLIQMFMPADAFWTLAMAVNVYLTFYFRFDAQRLRKMEVPYLLLCYGIPCVIAVTFLFVKTPQKGKMYGNATLWCWISPSWDIFRIATFYGPVWIVMLITFFIYIRAGREIYKKHKQLREFSYTTSHHDLDQFGGMDDLFTSVKTTEVFVTTEVADKQTIDLAPLGAADNRRISTASASPTKPAKTAYSVTISSNQRRQSHGDDLVLPIQTNVTFDSQATATTSAPIARTITGQSSNAHPLRRRAAWEANNAIWSYTKCAILFFTAMLVTWIPSSANRVYSLTRQGKASLPLEYIAAFVLPLQGFWNAIIYVVTSWSACKLLWADIKAFCQGKPLPRNMHPHLHPHYGPHDDMDIVMNIPGITAQHQRSLSHDDYYHQIMGSVGARSGPGGKGSGNEDGKKMFESESMTELAGSTDRSRSGSSSGPTVTMTGTSDYNQQMKGLER